MSKVIRFSAGLIALVVFAAGSAQAAIDDGRYTNQTPYGDPATTEIVAAPAGYDMFFIETVGRHGSRTMTSTADETSALNVWNAAKNKNALTTTGKRFASELKTFQAAERKIGYGRLTNLGNAEWLGIGRRTAENYKSFFTALPETDQIQRVTSTFARTRESASKMRIGMEPVVPGLTYAVNIVDEQRLELTNGSTAAGRASIAAVKKNTNVRSAANNVLRRMYSKKFVDNLKDPVGAAMDVYKLYCTGPAMKGHTSVTFAQYVAPGDARWLGYMKDAENFYRYGPGVIGETSSFRQVVPLLNDFFARLDQRIAGGNTAAVFRHGHGETTMPFAALIRAPGSELQRPASRPYTHANPWRGSVAGRPGGSIEWVAYKNSEGHVLVTMRYNEQPVDFKAGCDAAAGTPHFYEVSELKYCLRRAP